jgi:excisionase family DNA binding protein
MLAERIQPFDMNAAEVAELIKVHEATVRSAAASGRLRCLRVGRELRFSAADVADFLGLLED